MKPWFVFLCLMVVLGCSPADSPPPLSGPTPGDLAAHSEEFRREVIELTPSLYVAVGFGLANSILLVGDDGLVVVDTMESLESAGEVVDAFRQISQLPLKALIYTHNHADHVFGARAFSQLAVGPPRVLAHHSTAALIDRLLNVVRPIIGRRSLRMFGTFLDEPSLVNCGIGKELRIHENSTIDVLRPTETFDQSWKGRIAGIDLELFHAPGETDDQIFVWLPESKALLPGDNFYRAFPNLYTIRGTPYRDVRAWVASLDHMRRLAPEILVPSHSRPIVGADNVERALTDYRDAIQFVHDQTVRGMNQGLGVDELAKRVRLPNHLAQSPYLQELYGTVAWSVRSIFTGYLGWFDGDPAHLNPHGPDERAQRMVALAGGRQAFVDSMKQAEQDGDWPWLLELAGHLHRFDGSPIATSSRVKALRALGAAESNPNARHTYLTRALELDRGFKLFDMAEVSEPMLHAIPSRSYFESLAVSLDPEKSREMDQQTVFRFSDTGEAFTVHIRRGVAEIRPEGSDQAPLIVEMRATVFKEMLAKKRNLPLTLAGSEITVHEGNRLKLVSFFQLFAPQPAASNGWVF